MAHISLLLQMTHKMYTRMYLTEYSKFELFDGQNILSKLAYVVLLLCYRWLYAGTNENSTYRDCLRFLTVFISKLNMIRIKFFAFQRQSMAKFQAQTKNTIIHGSFPFVKNFIL